MKLQAGDVLPVRRGTFFAVRSPTWSLGYENGDSISSDGQPCKRSKCHQNFGACLTWNWIFQGSTSQGCSREMQIALDFATLNQKLGIPSMGIAKTAMLHAVRASLAAFEAKQAWENRSEKNHPFEFWVNPCEGTGTASSGLQPGRSESRMQFVADDPAALLKGILPHVETFVGVSTAAEDSARPLFASPGLGQSSRAKVTVNASEWNQPEQSSASSSAYSNSRDGTSPPILLPTTAATSAAARGVSSTASAAPASASSSLTSASIEMSKSRQMIVDAWEPPERAVVDPFSYDGFECSHCFVEIPNDYMHCVGCELLRWADYNLCIPCFQSYKMCATSKQKRAGQSPHISGNDSDARHGMHSQTTTGEERIPDEGTKGSKTSTVITGASVVATDCRAPGAFCLGRDGTLNGKGTQGAPRQTDIALTLSDRRRFQELSANTRRSHWVPEPDAAKTCPLLTKTEDLPVHQRAHHRACTLCDQCVICACLCHLDFTLRYRFEPNKDIRETLNQARFALAAGGLLH